MEESVFKVEIIDGQYILDFENNFLSDHINNISDTYNRPNRQQQK